MGNKVRWDSTIPKGVVMKLITCLSCQKELVVELVSYGSGHVATCPSCGKLAYNGK